MIAISRRQWELISAATAFGGNVRVGLEDNFYLSNGVMASSNGELVAQAAAIVEAAGRKIATPGEARALLSLSSDPDRTALHVSRN